MAVVWRQKMIGGVNERYEPIKGAQFQKNIIFDPKYIKYLRVMRPLK